MEKDPHCKQVLQARFPGIALLNDVAEVLPSMLANVDVIVAGFPCNDCSCENLKRPGLENGSATRSVAHVFRLLEGEESAVGAFGERCGIAQVALGRRATGRY